MSRLLHEIEWGEPLVAPQPEVDYERDLMGRFSPWLADAVRRLLEPLAVVYAPVKLMGVAYLVACQENACRYCYGSTRAMMKIWGYSEPQIQDLEQEATLAGGLTREVVGFTRKLARANPSPAREDYEALARAGLEPEAVSELAGCVVKACFANRMATFMALPPNLSIERLPRSVLGRLGGIFLRRGLVPRRVAPPKDFSNEGPCAAIIAAAGNTQIAVWLRSLTDGWLASPAFPRRSRLLMLAVIARQLGARLCEEEAKENLQGEAVTGSDLEAILSTLSSPKLDPFELRLLGWTRETVWYEPRVIQESTRRLSDEIGEALTLEAIGSAATCNTLVRLSFARQ
jgi:alkylhydroperoxidase family enzyme